MHRFSPDLRRAFTLHPLSRIARLALLCAAAVLSHPLTFPAAQAQATTASMRSYAIAPGPLAQVLAQYANSAGVALSFDAGRLGTLRSGGLVGEYTVEAGFAKVLEGSGLRAVREPNGAYTLRSVAQAAPEGVTTLPTVTVSASEALSSPTTEHSGSYASNAATVFKGVESIREIPQPVTIITRELMDDRGLLDLHDVLQNTPGISVDYTDSERVNYFSRGYQIDALQIDGLTIDQRGSIFVQPDTAILDRIEILRGATGMLRGSGNPSATVNLVRKRPTSAFQASAGLTLGSWDRRRFDGDIGGPLNEAGTLRGRLVVVADDKEFFQKAREENRNVVYGVIEADLGARTTLTASLQHTDLDATGAWGNLPANFDGSPLGLPRDTYLGAAWNRWNRYNQQAFAALEHRFDNDWNLKLSATYLAMRMKDDYGFKQSYFTRASTTDPYLFGVSTSAYSGDKSNQQVVNLTANGPFHLFGRRHELVVGAESQRVETIGTKGYFNVSPLTGVDIRTWDPYTSYPEPSTAEVISGTAYTGPDNTVRQQGIYATTRLSVTDPFSILAGARVSWWEYKDPANPRNNYKVDGEVTPYAGVVYDVADNLSVYASYTEIFTPQNFYDAGGGLLDPIRGEDYEAGLKAEFFGGRLTGTLAVFRINNVGRAIQNTATPNPCLPYYTGSYCYMAGGKTRSEGFELEVAGEILPGWQIMGGYTYTDTSVIRDPSAAAIGQPLRSIDPHHMLRLFTSYRFDGALHGLTVGGGAQIQSDSYVTGGGLIARQGGYAVYNLMLGYSFNKTYSVQLNVNNLFDKVYYKKYSPTGINTYYGDPRNAMLTLRASF